MPLSQLGKRPGDAWECGRCFSEGSRAVLTRDREPGCHICRDVTSAMGILSLVVRNSYSSKLIADLFAVETPFVARISGKRHASTLPIYTVRDLL